MHNFKHPNPFNQSNKINYTVHDRIFFVAQLHTWTYIHINLIDNNIPIPLKYVLPKVLPKALIESSKSF